LVNVTGCATTFAVGAENQGTFALPAIGAAHANAKHAAVTGRNIVLLMRRFAKPHLRHLMAFAYHISRINAWCCAACGRIERAGFAPVES
jgi:hypothetical protein